MLDLSEQYLIDCDEKNKGCRGTFNSFLSTFHGSKEIFKFSGGNPYKAFITVSRKNITFAQSYPFIGKAHDTCEYNPRVMPSVSCKGFDTKNYKVMGNEEALKQIVKNHGPVAATLRVTKNFAFYKSGIYFDDDCEGPKNHAVLITGYGTERGVDYW